MLVLLLVMFNSCKKEVVDYTQIDEDIITEYIVDNNLTAIATGTGLYYVVDTPGNGTQPNSQSTVTVAYKGYLTNGSVFDESASSGISFSLTSVIQGWQEGIPYFKEGGSGILLIPSELGYGSQATSGIPANSVLVFEVALIDVL
ncbi:MAG: FKBP-type peptidyl-prolyl cis-trans isomerase [Flavobacteriales bacterium]|nr:FKBP-type peptidyl-prolyl cis-trans isomerase [Flavobacteriales bacterium]